MEDWARKSGECGEDGAEEKRLANAVASGRRFGPQPRGWVMALQSLAFGRSHIVVFLRC